MNGPRIFPRGCRRSIDCNILVEPDSAGKKILPKASIRRAPELGKEAGCRIDPGQKVFAISAAGGIAPQAGAPPFFSICGVDCVGGPASPPGRTKGGTCNGKPESNR